MSNVDEQVFVSGDASASPMAPVRIFRDASAEARAEQAYAAYLAEGVKIVSGTVYALFGAAVAILCGGVLLLQGEGSRPKVALALALAVAVFGVMRSGAASDRRDGHAATIRQRRPYIVTAEAEQALSRIITVVREQHAINPLSSGSAEAEELLSRSWRLMRALDVSTSTWRFDDPASFGPLVAEKAQQGEHERLLMLADRAERNLEETRRRRDEAIAIANRRRDEAFAAKRKKAAERLAADTDSPSSANGSDTAEHTGLDADPSDESVDAAAAAAETAEALASEVRPDEIAALLSGGVADDVAEWELNNPPAR